MPCTAFHAARRTNLNADCVGDLIGINLMPLGGHYSLNDDINEGVWKTKIEAFLPKIRKYHRLLFIAHDVSEKKYMEQFLGPGEVIFSSSCWRDYLPVYAKCAATVANRVHGAVCAAGFGRPSVILGNDTRLLIGDYIGIPSRYIGDVSPEEVVDLLESGLRDRRSEKDRLLGLREESAARYRQAIVESLEKFQGIDKLKRMEKGSSQNMRKNALKPLAETGEKLLLFIQNVPEIHDNIELLFAKTGSQAVHELVKDMGVSLALVQWIGVCGLGQC